MATLDGLTGTVLAEHPVLSTATPFPMTATAAATAAAAYPGWVPGIGAGAAPIEIIEAIRLIRMGSLVGLATLLTTPPPRPCLIRLAPDMVLVANWRPGLHAFYLQGADGKWRQSPVIGQGTPDGVLIADLPALERGYGRPLPPGVLAMARPRPRNVPKSLQTTDTSIATAMANAPDPCKNLPGQRHHMIPAALMEVHQSFLTAIDFTLDQGANLIRLPSDDAQKAGMLRECAENRPIHRGPTARIYERAVSSQLNTIEGELNAGQITRQGAAQKVQRLMSLVRQELESGRYTNVNDPALSRAIASWRI